MVKRDANGMDIIPELDLAGTTIVHDRARNMQVMRIRGVVVLPVGAEVELVDPNINAVVIGVRLLAGNENIPVNVCLDVEVPAAYWDEEER